MNQEDNIVINILIDIEIDQEKKEYIQSIKGIKVETIGPNYEEKVRWITPEILNDKEIIFCSVLPENLKDMNSLKWVQIDSAGYNQIVNIGLNERGIRASNAQGVFDTPIAEWNIAMMVNLARDLRGMIRNQEAGIWDRSSRFQKEIRNAVVGIWGYGAIGRETARLAKDAGMKVYAMGRKTPINEPRTNKYCLPGTGDPEGKLPDRIFYGGQEKEFLKDLDFLVITMPLTKYNDSLIGETELRSLPSKAYVLNPARGRIIKEEALLKALREGWIAGAALDTHYYYPMPADHPLWRFPNVIITPHISGSSLSTFYCQRIWDIFAQNVERYVNDMPLLNELSVEQLSGK
jgi:phosphoglycerate dehydrogenase-like enzyme